MALETSEDTTTPSLGERFRFGEVQALVTPTVLWFSAFLLAPLAIIAVYSFLTYESFSVVWEFSLTAWESVFDQTVYSTFVRTLVVGVGVTALCLLFGYPIAYYLRFYTSESGGTLLLLFLVIPFWTSALIRTIGWNPILGRTGVINRLLLWVGVVEEPLSWLLFSPFSQMVGYVAAYVVFMAAPIFVSLSQIDEDLLDASETLRGGPVATFRHITLPLSLPGVTIGAIFVFVLSIGDFMVPQFLSGGESTITTLIYLAVNNGLNYPNAAALSIVLLLVIFVVVYAMTRIVDISEITQG
ncbi:ABC transporter permease [Haloferax volcanii]|uniref:Spermidine/putrescine ABC transporter permease n=3 Tax=Haloferax volcanii TaxID=2246 RepID=A0A384LF62_HALVD|nr:ABC transporter permease [Haloferax volcanii]ADE02187.1 ABC-type transport system permease protein [Haloferax volcanii DS2]ELY31421.1 spermidine/putrescine ABC transporter permease [Haloferax volcanii DS2]MBS8120765.1 ABC transporter permease [Haloferax volcanii]MBS8125802.1 ABC transporter permease [Haloferax volcanii]MBS8129586.1 ABC transporter permease [Haloferax volcanii]